MESTHTKRIYEERLCSVKIEVGDVVNTAHHKNVVVEKIDSNRFTPVVYFYSKEQEGTVGAWLSNCTLVKKERRK